MDSPDTYNGPAGRNAQHYYFKDAHRWAYMSVLLDTHLASVARDRRGRGVGSWNGSSCYRHHAQSRTASEPPFKETRPEPRPEPPLKKKKTKKRDDGHDGDHRSRIRSASWSTWRHDFHTTTRRRDSSSQTKGYNN